MAIKEFQVQPQIYFEEKYFDGDYFYNNSEIRTQLTASANIIKNVDAVMVNDFAVVADNLRVRFGQVTLNNYLQEGYYASGYFETRGSIYSLTTVAEVIVRGEVKEFDAELSATSTLVVEQRTIKQTAVELLVESQQVTNAIRTKETAANMSAEFALLSSAGRIQQAQCNFEALFAPSFTANAVTNTFAVLDSTAALATVATANRSADIALASIINLGLQGDKVTGYVAALESEFQQTADNLRTRNQSAQFDADFVVSAVNDRTRTDTAAVSAEFGTVTVNDRTRNSAALVNVVSSLDAEVEEIVQISADFTASTTVVTALSIEKQFAADLGSLFTPSVSIDGTLNTFAVLDTVATMSVSAVKSTVTAAEIAGQAQQSTVGLRIRPYVSNTVNGIHVNRTVQLSYVDNDLDNFSLQNAVFSFWAKRDEIRNRQVLLDHSRYQLTNSNFFPFPQQYMVLESFNLALENNNFRLYGYSQGGTGAPNSDVSYTWTNVNNDFEWHHYLVTTRFEGLGSGRRLVTTLYRDGVEFSTQNIFAPYYGVNFSNSLNLGNSGEVNGFPYIYGAVVGPEISANTRLNGSIAQLWLGTVLANNFNINNYYNNGYVTTLPETVVIYDDLDTLPNNSLVGKNNQGNTIPVNQENFGNNTYSIQGPLSSQALISITARAGFFNIANVSAQFGSTVTAQIIGDNQVLADSVFTQNSDLDRIRFGQWLQSVDTELSVDAAKSVSAESSMQVTATAVITDIKTVSAQAQLTAITQASTVENKLLSTPVDLISEFAQATSISRTKQFTAELAGFAAVIQVTSKIAGFFVNCDVVSTLSATAITSVDNSAELSTNTDVTATVRKITKVTADLVVNSQQSTDIKRFRSTVEEFDVTASITVATEFSKITRTGAAEYTAEFAQSTVTDTSKIVSAVSTITAAFNSELTPDLFKRYTVNTTAVTDTAVTAVKTVSAAAEFDSIAVKLIDSTVLSYDRALTLTVLSEFRTLSLHEEPLILMVEPETRVNMVRKTA